MLSRLLIVPRAALDVTAWTLRTAADVTEQAAAWVREDAAADEAASAADTADAAGEAAEASAAAGEARTSRAHPAPAPLPDAEVATAAAARSQAASEGAPAPVVPAESRRRAAVFSPEGIAAAPVRRAISALEGLSSSELSALYEHEAATRNRKTLLRAIEQSLVPPDPARETASPEEAAEDEALTDVRDVDAAPRSETVYSTRS